MPDLMDTLRSQGPVSPAVQMRTLMAACRSRQWEFEMAWRWSWERVRWPHDTAHRLDWKGILGESPTDPRRVPIRQREIWFAAYEGIEIDPCVVAAGRLIAA